MQRALPALPQRLREHRDDRLLPRGVDVRLRAGGRLGDSSPVDDGTGQPGNTLYDGWNDPAGTNAEWALNATDWLGKLS